MIRFLVNFWLFFLLIIPNASCVAAENPLRAIIFLAPNCPPCTDFKQYLLPALIERYGKSLEFAQFDITQPSGANIYQAARTLYSLGEWQTDPVVIIGKQAIVGLDAIATTLGDNFSSLIAEENNRIWPELPKLNEVLPYAIQDFHDTIAKINHLSPENWQSRFLRDPIANSLAVTVLLIMSSVLTHIVIRLRRKALNPRAANLFLPIILLAGIGISAYTAYAALEDIKPICGPIGDCVTVQASVYSRFFGIPLGIFGILAYSTLLISYPIATRLSPKGGGWRWLPWIVALAGFLFSLRLTILEPFFIGATCLWCLGSALAMTAAFWIFTGLIFSPHDLHNKL